MKLLAVIRGFYRLILSNKRIEYLKLLQQQRFLLREGMEASAEIIETLMFDEKVGSMRPARLWVKLRKTDGTYIYTHTSTLVTLSHVPGKGEIVKIKYIPDNLSTILIL